ncbi:TetR family transcriptional regulator [Oceanimonas sp. NS1]|nr:TetR family transcriptional regulator [Oceanimonas sp. NS1]
MQVKTGRIRQENTEERRADLIAATLRVIAREGVRGATVRSISKEADVTQGLIRYYFKSKDELIAAAYETYMGDLVNAADAASQGSGSARRRLAKFVQVSLEPPVTSHASVAIWAGFFEVLLHDPAMKASHNRSYDKLRLHLKTLIRDLFDETGRIASDDDSCVASVLRATPCWTDSGSRAEPWPKYFMKANWCRSASTVSALCLE